MDCPPWVPAPAWARLDAVLCGQPEHAHDTLGDIEAVTRRWTPELRCLLLERFTLLGEAGLSLPAALLVAVGELMGEVSP